VLEHAATDVLIGVEDVHPSRTRLVRDIGDGAYKRHVLDVAPDVEVLAGTEVETHAHDELRVPPHEVL
jgi:hypothetical protein